ncbi:MAG: ribonuclease HII [Clostridiaceae bacterium]|nr:ribonuclease HII [Clostridiaceae bacterium]
MQKKVILKEIEKEIECGIYNLEPASALEYLDGIKDKYGAGIEKLVEKHKKRLAALEAEKRRYEEISVFEREAYNSGARYIAGVDEAGRGPLAGPVVAAAVILPEGVFIKNLKDSKKLSPAQRDVLYEEIIKKAVSYGIGIVDEKCIDEINILKATKLAMEKAIKKLLPAPDIIFIDAVSLDNINIKQKAIEKGDNLSISIAAASILAKVTRDRIIESKDSLYPVYGFARHKGYGTKEHIEAIKKYGACPVHRMSFIKKFL